MAFEFEAMAYYESLPNPTREHFLQARAMYHKNLHHWLIWYYSPLNIWYWAIAMLCFTPALTFHLIAKHLLWCRTKK